MDFDRFFPHYAVARKRCPVSRDPTCYPKQPGRALVPARYHQEKNSERRAGMKASERDRILSKLSNAFALGPRGLRTAQKILDEEVNPESGGGRGQQRTWSPNTLFKFDCISGSWLVNLPRSNCCLSFGRMCCSR